MDSDQNPAGKALSLEPGTLIDNVYEVGAEVGSGAFGKVFAGVQHPIGRKVAIKVLAVRQDEKARKRFLREAQATAAIDHPNVVTIYHFGILPEGYPYIVMEFLNGHDLEEEIQKNGPMDRDRARVLFLRCLDALAAAHEDGIIHKDLKPSNLFLTYPGQPRELLKIVDFGIAHMAKGGADGQDAARLTSQGNVVGTPQYLAPEYIETQDVSPAVDVYQMGLILCEALTGEPVVQSSKLLDAVMAHMEGVSVPDDLAASPWLPLLTRALSRAPEARHPDAGALRDALAAESPPYPAAPVAELEPDETGDTTIDVLRAGPPLEPAVQTNEGAASAENEASALPLLIGGVVGGAIVVGVLIAWAAGVF